MARARTTTPGETAVLEVYENMASVLSRKEPDCEETGAAVLDFVREGETAFAALADERSAKSSPSNALDPASPRLERLRQALRTGIARCPNQPKIQEALKLIAASSTNP